MSVADPGGPLGPRTRVLGLSAEGTADAGLATAVGRGGGLGLLDLGGTRTTATEALLRSGNASVAPFGVRIPAGCELTPAEVLGDPAIGVVVLGEGSPWQIPEIREQAGRPLVLAEVIDLREAAEAVESGVDGLIARGHEAGGRVGDLTSFVLLQQLLAAPDIDVPVWVCGGVGPHTAIGAVAGGAAGVVLDSQLGLFPESGLPARIRAVLERTDGSETAIVDGRRVFRPRNGGQGEGLPLGQDAHLASAFAARYETAEQAVREIVESLADPARDVDPEVQGAPIRRSLGVTRAVAQGPMTRVSDQPGFARAVADHGAMPYVAVALADGGQTAKLLADTGELLGERPWGAGILGFVPDELRAVQLAAIREARPRSVLIAGGRPSQAAELEAEGIPAYLHVPSPILLRQFLAAGARRFVFEGAECGGHVGPRSSFSLWEAQLEVLREFLDAEPDAAIEVFFAGGVHDARSAAIVHAMAAPLARRGVGVGVLMGTAYLFTDEAVRHGAITGLFQRQAVEAGRTVTLETAPGHQTRCLHSPFVDEFRAVDEAMRADGVAAQERWERLEELNTGRLRVASKGIRREGAELVQVGEDEQFAEGMYMAGQVAVLRAATTNIAALHDEVTDGAAGLLRESQSRGRAEVREVSPPEPVDVAIVGMACVFPGAPDLASYWSNLLHGVDAVTEVPPQRWDPEVYYRPPGEAGAATTPSKWGGFLPEVAFDPMSYGIPPASMGSIDPAQLLSLEVARRALEDAGYGERAFDRDRAGVIFGAESGGDLANAGVVRALLPSYVDEIPAELDEQLPKLTEDSFPGTLANVIAGRIANRLDLGGANYTVDAACGSSLAALDLACKELVQGSGDMMLCGAVDLHNGINDYLMFASAGALSPTGRCRPFDQGADGIALGEGVACLVLKRLPDAQRDGDRVYAVIRGVGAASDGRSLGLTAPRPEGQLRALQRAYHQAGISPAQVGMVEAHGTGTVVGDATELRTLTRFFGDAGAAPAGCALGSVKSQIGHTKCAAGLAGVIKAALSLSHGVLPPTLHLRDPNKAWDGDTSPFAFTTEARPWAAPREARAAGVSAFGFGGTNFHTVLTAGPSATGERHGLRDWDAELFLFRGAEAEADMRKLLERLDGEQRSLAEWAAITAERSDREIAPVRFAVVAADRGELAGALRAALAGESGNGVFAAEPDAEPGKLAFLFPGQGSQRTGMLGELFVAFPELRHFLDVDPETAAVAFPPQAGTAEQEARLRDTRNAQPALGIVESALRALLDRLEIRPDMLAGHSYGELVALSAAGAFDFPALLRMSRNRAQAILAAAGDDPGAMAAVKASRDDVAAVLDGSGVVIGNHNSPEQTVLSGPTEAIDRIMVTLREKSLPAKKIPVACAFHSPVVASAGEDFAKTLAGERVQEPRVPVWSNRTAQAYAGDVRSELAAQIGSPVRFAEQIEDMYRAGARTFVEVGPGSVLTAFVGKILADRPHTVVACAPGGTGLRGLLTAVARLAVAGVDVRAEWLSRGRSRPAKNERAPQWTVDGQLVRRVDGSRVPNGLVPAERRTTMKETGDRTGTGADAAERERVLTEFLRSNREIVAAQRDVLLSYFGAAGTPAAPSAPPPIEITQLPEPEQPQQAAPAIPEPPAPAPETQRDALTAVVDVISERTGYPAEMIGSDLDLESDLSIDSIKRTEIAGILVAELGLSDRVDAAGQEELSGKRTVAAIAGWLEEYLGQSAPASSPAVVTSEASTENPVQRLVLRAVPAAEIGGHRPRELRGMRVLLVCEPAQAALCVALEAEFGRHGATVQLGSTSERPMTGFDAVLCLTPLGGGDEPVAPQVFCVLRDAARAGATTLAVAAPLADDLPPHTAGLRGLLRAVSKEREDLSAKVIEVDQAATETEIARELVGELRTDDRFPVVQRHSDRRTAFRLAAEELDIGGPPGAAELGLDRDSVVLLVGGARGITARFATALAASTGCRIELAGRTLWTGAPEDPLTSGVEDPLELRRVLAANGSSLSDAERQARTILAQREVARTCEEIRATGSEAGYHTVDVRDGAVLGQLVKDLYTRHGRLDGVVFAAGVIDDKLMADKDDDSFRTVFGTKVDGAQALLDALTQLGARPRFVTFFGSISAVLGNRGQTDYAAANDALETLGAGWAERTGNRVLTVHWGPWAPSGGGMVTPELAREYERRDVRLIDPETGTASLLRELAYGTDASVVYTASTW